jgi:hypothetical protein
MKYTGQKYSESSRRKWEFFFSCGAGFPLVFADIKELLSQFLNTEKQFNDKQKALQLLSKQVYPFSTFLMKIF